MPLTRGGLRTGAVFIGHALVAVIGTAMITDGMGAALINDVTWRQWMQIEDAINISGAFILGCCIFASVKSIPAKWTWTFGAAVMFLRAGIPSFGFDGTLFWELRSHGAFQELMTNVPPDDGSANDWMIFTLTFLRTSAYSLGAISAGWVQRRRAGREHTYPEPITR